MGAVRGETLGGVIPATFPAEHVEHFGEDTQAYGYAVALGSDNGESQTGFGVDAARGLDDLDPRRIAHEAAERAARMLGARWGQVWSR